MNFLLGKQPNGPGQYLFGMVKPKAPTCMFPIDYSAMNATEEDMEPFRYILECIIILYLDVHIFAPSFLFDTRQYSFSFSLGMINWRKKEVDDR